MAESRFVSRAGEKLDGALDAFGIDVAGGLCADFGCNVGGFTDCLLQRGASKVYAVDTGYGQLAWKLRKDPRVVVCERTNALYAPPPQAVDLVVCDVAWTPQELIVPVAMRWLKSPGSPGPCRAVISLLKPHYELAKMTGQKPTRTLSPSQSRAVCLEVCQKLSHLKCAVRAVMPSVLRGKGGNEEFFLFLSSY